MPFYKQAKIFKQTFYQKRYMNSTQVQSTQQHTMSLVIREMKQNDNEIPMDTQQNGWSVKEWPYHMLARMQRNWHFTTGGNAKWHRHLGRVWRLLKELNIHLTDNSSSTPANLPKIMGKKMPTWYSNRQKEREHKCPSEMMQWTWVVQAARGILPTV